MKRIAIIDNHDSFTYNLVHMLERDPQVEVEVFLNNAVDLQTLSGFRHFVLSPGPGLPSEAGITMAFLREFSPTRNILGICLGMQAVGEHFGASLFNLNQVMHGIATPVEHLNNDILFTNIPANFNVGRYHSWVVDKSSALNDLEVTARDTQGEIMGIKHRYLNVRGVQFHPESILSEYGEVMLRNWTDKIT